MIYQKSYVPKESDMKKIGIIICGRYQTCGGGKCLRSMKERVGGFARYPREEELELVGYSFCGGMHYKKNQARNNK